MASTDDKRPAAASFPLPPANNSLQALTRLRPGSIPAWSTIAFVLNKDMIKADGTLDELHAVIFPLGSFTSKSEAERHAAEIMAATGHPAIIAARYGAAVPLTSKFNPNNINQIYVDMQGRIVDLENAEIKRENEEYDRQMKREQDIVQEAQDETDPESIEHFKRQAFLAVKNMAAYRKHKRDADSALAAYNNRRDAVRNHYKRHPEHEKEWLPYLKAKLTERRELPLYDAVEAGYNEIRSELLDLD
jgi:hypothetical protein